MINTGVHIQLGIIGIHKCTCTQRGLHKTRCASASATCASRGTTSATTRSAGSQTTDPTARSSLNHAGVYATENAARFGTQDVSISDGQVVASDSDIQIIFQR